MDRIVTLPVSSERPQAAVSWSATFLLERFAPADVDIAPADVAITLAFSLQRASQYSALFGEDQGRWFEYLL
jgi:hypothetical protein